MKRIVKTMGIVGPIGALALTIADDICHRNELSCAEDEYNELDEMWEKEMKLRIEWMSLAEDYRWHRDIFGLERLDKQYDDLRTEI